MLRTADRRQFLASAGMAATGAVLMRQTAFASGVPVDTIFRNGRIWTGEGRGVFTDGLGVVDGRIAALGLEAAHSLADRRTRVIDLDGALVTPGFIDSHVHFTMASLALGEASLRDAPDRAAFTAQVAKAAAALAPGQWMKGGNWDNDRWGGELPTRDWIDAVTPQTPVAVVRYDLHMVLLNSLALERLGLDEKTPAVDGGVIARDAKGRLTGIFKDAAKDMVLARIPAPTVAEVDAANRRGIALALSKGVVQAHDATPDWSSFEALRRLPLGDDLPFRFYAMAPLAGWKKLAGIIAAQGRGTDFMRWGCCKVVFDGSLGSRTALFYEPYLDDPTTRGIMVTDPAALHDLVLGADGAGLQIAAHAIGDRANDIVLDTFAEAAKAHGPRDRRLRIEHAQHLAPSALGRFAEQDVIASVQPYHAIDDGRWAIRRIGAERLKTTYAFESLLRSGAHVAFGSDWPVAPIDPLTGLDAAVMRRTLDGQNPQGWYPQQRVPVEDAMLCYTRGAAYAGMDERRTGTLAPGRCADFVAWDSDLTTMDPATLTRARVQQVWVGARKAHG